MTAESGDAPSYSSAVSELQSILGKLESEDVDVDLLAGRVRRAVELIGICRERITVAEMEVRRIVAELDDDADGDRVVAPDED